MQNIQRCKICKLCKTCKIFCRLVQPVNAWVRSAIGSVFNKIPEPLPHTSAEILELLADIYKPPGKGQFSGRFDGFISFSLFLIFCFCLAGIVSYWEIFGKEGIRNICNLVKLFFPAEQEKQLMLWIYIWEFVMSDSSLSVGKI